MLQSISANCDTGETFMAVDSAAAPDGNPGPTMTAEDQVHSRTPVLLRFSVSSLPRATGRWRERGRMGPR